MLPLLCLFMYVEAQSQLSKGKESGIQFSCQFHPYVGLLRPLEIRAWRLQCTFYVSFPSLSPSLVHYGHVQNVLPSRCETSFIPRLHEEEKRVKLFEFKSKQALGVQDFMTQIVKLFSSLLWGHHMQSHHHFISLIRKKKPTQQ